MLRKNILKQTGNYGQDGMRCIHPDAQIGRDVRIESFVTIDGDVVIGDGTWIGPNVSILEGTRIGKNCKIFQGAIVGSIPQDLKFNGEYSTLEIGDNVTVREYCTLNRGTKSSHKTVIKNNCLLMAYVHVAHDCIIEEKCVLANNVNLAGHIHLGKNVILGGLTAVHQFVRVGDHAMVSGGSLVRKDIPPYIKVAREPLSYVGVNSIGLRRRGFSNEQINIIQDIYRILFAKGLNTTQAIKHIESSIVVTPELQNVLQFIRSARRGIIRGYRYINGSKANGSYT